MGPFLSHSVRFILSDIVVILWWSYLRCIDSHIIISVEYMSNLLYIPMGLFLSHRDRLDALVAILGHISLFLTWRGFFSHRPYSLHYSTEEYLFALLDVISMIFAEMSSQRSTTFGFWLPHYPWLFSRLLCWDRGSYSSGLFSWDSPIDHSFEMTMASSSRAFRVRRVRLIVTLRQTWWFSQILWGYIYSRFNLSNLLTDIFWDSRSLFQTLLWIESCGGMLHWGIFSPHHILAFSAWYSKPPCLLNCDV